MNSSIQFPRQALPDKRKTDKWRRQHMLWAEAHCYQNFHPVRKSVQHKRTNYNLLNGILDMSDVALLLNPSDVEADYIPEKIQHFPIMNAKLAVLMGEELKRPFDWRAVVTNMNAISEIEEAKKQKILQSLQQLVENTSLSEEDYANKLEELNEQYAYNYQDFREKRANEYLRHYIKENNLPLLFNSGFYDALAVGEEIYMCDIVGGEPVIDKLDPNTVRIFRSGYSNKIEDADIIIIEEYWNPGRILDTYGDKLKKRDIEYLENLPQYLNGGVDSMGHVDERDGFVPKTMMDETFSFDNDSPFDIQKYFDSEGAHMPYDENGNVRVIRMLWKSRRRIKKVKWYDEETGEEHITFYREDYVIDENKGEEEQDLYINEAWEGTLIGGRHSNFDEHKNDGTYGIFVNINPRPVQYNRMSNPSKCSLGVVGTIYTVNGQKPFSLVDMMKPYNYLYDVLHYRLVDAISASWGSLAEVDLAKIPGKWSFDKWMYFAKVNHLAVVDSFNEGQEGAAKGKLAANLNNNTQRIITDSSFNYIQQLMNLAEWAKLEMGEIVGVTRQREGQVANRETVGGVERSVLQSSYITERWFAIHRDTKRRALDCYLETIKMAAKGKKVKFMYVSSDSSERLMEFDGDEFAENDYGIVMDDSSDILDLDQKIERLGEVALQQQMANLSDIMKMWSSANSLSEKIRIMQNSERKRLQQAQQAQEMESQQVQAQLEANAAMKEYELEQQASMNRENNETKILIAQMQAAAKANEGGEINDGISEPMSEEAKAKLKEQIREFDIQIQQDNKKLDLEKEKNDIARIAAKRKPASSK